MSITKDQVAEVLALPLEQRTDVDAEDLWNHEIDQRSRDLDYGSVKCRPVADPINDIRTRLDANRQSS